MMRMRGVRRWALGAWVVTTVAAAAIEVPLEYVAEDMQGRSGYIPGGAVGIETTPEPPRGTWQLPELSGARQRYGLLELGGGQRLVIIEASEPEGFYTRLLFDTDGDGDLKEETGLVSGNSGESWAFWGPADIIVPVDGKETPYRLLFQAFRSEQYRGEELVTDVGLMARSLCAYRGSFDLDGKTYEVLLGDSMCNGTFTDRVAPIGVEQRRSVQETGRAAFERVFISGDRFALRAGGRPGYADTVYTSRYLHLNGTLYSVEIDIPEKRMTFEPADSPLISVKLGQEVDILLLTPAEAGGTSVMSFGRTDTVEVPEGDYIVSQYLSERQDPQGDRWRIMAAATYDTPACTVRGGGAEPVRAVFGEPYTPSASIGTVMDVRQDGTGEVELEFAAIGSAKEMVTMLSRVDGTKTSIPMSSRASSLPKEPTYKIVTEEGETVAQGQFEYG